MYQITNNARIAAFYGLAGVPVTGLTVTALVESPSGTQTTPSVVDRGDGWYTVNIIPNELGTWLVQFHTVGSVDSPYQVAAFPSGQGGVSNLDATISSRSTLTIADLSGFDITLTNPVLSPSGNMIIYQGDDYFNVDGRAITFNLTNPPDLTGASVFLIIQDLEKEGVISDIDTIYFELDNEETTDFDSGNHQYDVNAILDNGHLITLARGFVNIVKNQT